MSSGGLELLFDNLNKHRISIPSKDDNGSPVNVGFLIRYLCENVMKDQRKDLFVVNDAV